VPRAVAFETRMTLGVKSCNYAFDSLSLRTKTCPLFLSLAGGACNPYHRQYVRSRLPASGPG